jgi:hypothetical protein
MEKKMKTTILILSLAILSAPSFLLASDLPTAKAVQGKDTDYFDYEDSDIRNGKVVPIGKIEFLPGCSWYCGGSVKKITASSEMATE